MTYVSLTAKLTVTKTNNKAGIYHYQVIDKATGNVLAERRSNRKYVAATIDGNIFFGRLELAQKDAASRITKGAPANLVNGCYAVVEDVKAFDEHE